MSKEITTGASSFEALLGEIGADLVKALPAPDAEGGEDTEGGADEGEGAEGGAGDDAGMSKSFDVTLADGSVVKAVDGETLIKSLMGRIETNEGVVVTALRGFADAFAKQGELVKSLQGKVEALANSGKGRKAVIAVTERPASTPAEGLAKSASPQMTGEEFMAKALSAQALGAISGGQVALAEQYINANQAPPQDIVQAVLSATSAK